MGVKRKRRWVRVSLVVLAVLVAVFVFLHLPIGSTTIVIAKDTTAIDGPLGADGTIDYVAALDAQFAQGVTPKNNAAPALLRAFGSAMLKPAEKQDALRRLGLSAEEIDKGNYFVSWADWPGHSPATNIAPQQSSEMPDFYSMLLRGEVPPDLEAWLGRNSEAFDWVKQATTKPRYYLPLVSTASSFRVIDASGSPVHCFMHAAHALMLRAVLRSNRNDHDGAWDDILTAHRLARLLQQRPNLFSQLVASRIEHYASMGGIALATRSSVPSAKDREMLAELHRLPPMGNMADYVNVGERFEMLDSVVSMSLGQSASMLKDIPGFSANTGDLDWNVMLRSFNAFYDKEANMLRAAEVSGNDGAGTVLAQEQRIMDANLSDGSFRTRLYMSKVAGWPGRPAFSREIVTFLLWVQTSPLVRAVDLHDEARMTHEIEIIAVALACFHGENGRWPSDLSELRPGLLDVVPMDRFGGRPLVYRANNSGYVLYSIGINRRDDGGTEDYKSDKDDIAAKIMSP